MANSTNTVSYLSGKKLAIASLLIGTASLFTFTLMIVGSISGIALGIIALRGVKGNPARGLSKAMAVAGILLSIVAFLPPYFYAAGNANAACTETRLQSIGAAEARYLEVIGRYGTLEELARTAEAAKGLTPLALPTLLAGIRAQLFTLPDDTVVFPGHGPATTIGRERATNPYLIGAA